MSRILFPPCLSAPTGDDHPSRRTIAGRLKQLTLELGRAPSIVRAGTPRERGAPSCLAPGGVYRAAAVTCGAGALLPHLFTLTLQKAGRYLSVALVLRLPSAGVTRYPCPVEPGLSSSGAFRPPSAAVRPGRGSIVPHNGEIVKHLANFFQRGYTRPIFYGTRNGL